MKTETVMVSPKIARAWLEKNTANRPLRKSFVEYLSAAIKRGEWVLTHQGIAFAKDGRLLDGQHRLAAIADSGATVPVSVSRDVPERGFPVIDCGIKRTMRDLTGLDSRLCDVAAYLCGVATGAKRYSSKQVMSAADFIRPYHDELMQACGAMRPKRGAAPIRAAACLRMVNADEKARHFVLTQYPAFIHLRVADMAPSMGALLRKVESYSGGGGEAVRQGLGAAAWVAFDMANKNRTTIRIADHRAQYADMRAKLAPKAQERQKRAA